MPKPSSFPLVLLFCSQLLALPLAKAASFWGIPNSKPYVGASFGSVQMRSTANNSRQVLSSSLPEDTFSTSGTDTANSFGLAAGLDIARAKHLGPWLTGYEVQASLWHVASEAKGVHTMPFFTTQNFQYNYRYAIALTTLSLEGFADVYHQHNISVYGGAGIDMGNSQVRNYQETALNGAPTTAVNFANKQDAVFFYHVGLGLGYTFNSQWRVRLFDRYYFMPSLSSGAGNNGSDTFSALHASTSLNRWSVAIQYLF
jgi:opacity protein-like surface antigen